MSEGYGTDDRLIGQFDGQDPYLQYQPAFAYTLPIQLFVNGITITLLLVLFMHLAFTTQYHYPLAPLNYSLQLLSIVTVIISVTVKIWVILVDSSDSADTWPYSLDYVAVSIPPRAWNTAQDAAWFVLQTFNNVLTHITHIQFLTLLYPSRTEARLIIFVLGPLAVISSGLCLSALSGSQTVLDVTDSIRNVLNSTLLLIYSMALVIWGFFVNRRRAWRTDGGTAAFGFGAMVLAAISTSGNFVAVAEDGIDWLQHLLFAAILWQTWLGWWWWVGSGMGIGEVEDLMERAERKKRKAARRAARQRATERGERIPLRHRSSSLAGIVDAGQASANAMAGFTTSVTGILRNRSATLVRRSTTRSVPSDSRVRDVEEGLDGRANSSPAIEMENLGGRRSGDRASRAGTNGTNGTGRVEFTNTPTPPDSRTGAVMQSTNSETSSTSATPSLHTPRTFGQLMSFPINGLQVYLRRLRRAHEEAARQAALQRVERRQAVFESSRRESATGGGAHAEGPQVTNSAALAEAALIDGEGVGWGLGSFGIKEHRESAMRLQAARERLQEGQLLNTTREENEQLVQSSREAAVDAENTGEGTSAGPSTPLRSNQTAGGQGRPELAPVVDSDTPGPSAGPSREPGRSRARQNQVRESDGEWEDLDETTSSSSGGRFTWRKKDRKRANKGKRRSDDAGGDATSGRTGAAGETGRAEPTMQGGWSWWGPLKEWRLNDRSAF